MALLFSTELTVRLRVEDSCALRLRQCSQVVVDQGLHYFLTMLKVVCLEVDESVAHLGIVGATRSLQLELNIIHHDDFLA